MLDMLKLIAFFFKKYAPPPPPRQQQQQQYRTKRTVSSEYEPYWRHSLESDLHVWF